MASRRAQRADGTRSRLGRVWQLPLFVASLGLFGYAAYLFWHGRKPPPEPTVDQRIERIQALVKNDRFEAALEAARALRAGATAKAPLPPDADARAHLLQAEAVEAIQRRDKADLPANHAEIIEHTRAALAIKAKSDPKAKLPAAAYRRAGESYEALGRTDDALASYRDAIALDPEKAPPVLRKVVDIHLARADADKSDKEAPAAAEAALGEYLKAKELSDTERTWAVGEQSRLLVDRGEYAAARLLLATAIRADGDPVAQGQVNYRLGYCEWKLGNAAEAERYLRVARDQLKVQHPLDADAAWLLGRILQDKGEPREAITFYDAVIVSHPDSTVAPLARLGRGVCRVEAGEENPGLADLHEVAAAVVEKPSRARYRADALAALQSAGKTLAARGNDQATLELMEQELALAAEPPAEFYGRLSAAYEKRAEQVEKSAVGAATEAEQTRRMGQARDLRVKAGDAAIAHSRALTVGDDEGHARALWRGIDLFDAAGELPRAIDALETFVGERPGDAQTPDALLRLGRSHQAAGQFDKAIEAFQRNQFRYPQSLAATKSGVPLAQTYVAKGPAFYPKAEAALVATLESPLLTPAAEDFKDALFELAQLYYRTGRYEDAVPKMEEMAQRYPGDPRTGQLLFLMADSYRKSAALLKEGKGVGPAAVAAATSATSPVKADAATTALANQLAAQAEAAAARRDRLLKARALYDRAIEQFHTTPPARETDKLYQKLAHFYRADCLYDTGSYEDAIRLYDAAALRYQDDPSALAAYVQIVNAYVALGRPEEAKAANERAKWLLRRMPSDAFKDGAFAMPKAYWENWLKWSGEAGMW